MLRRYDGRKIWRARRRRKIPSFEKSSRANSFAGRATPTADQ